MKRCFFVAVCFLGLVATLSCAQSSSAQPSYKLGDNAALRYWSAFAQMQDSAITDEQAKELNLILAGTAPYDDSKYSQLVEKNQPALQTMARGTELRICDWGLEYQLKEDAPVDYVRKALTLGRLNVLNTFHFLIVGNKDGAVQTLAAGLRFSRDVANGGTLFATVVAKSLITEHLTAIAFALHTEQLSTTQRALLQKAVAQLGSEGLDWQSAVKQELNILPTPGAESSTALARINMAYRTALKNPSALPRLQEAIANAPQPLDRLIANPARVLDQKQELTESIRRTNSLLQ
jgi:hypothetical protein